MSVSSVVRPHAEDVSEWWCGVWKPSPRTVLKLRSVTVLIRRVNLITLKVLRHIFILITSVQIPFVCLLHTYVPGQTGSPSTAAAPPPALFPQRLGGHLASSELPLKPCGCLPAARLSQFKASSLTLRYIECPCLPLRGEGSPIFGGLAVVSSAA